MNTTLYITGSSALIVIIVLATWIRLNKLKRLDKLYRNALHAESTGQYAEAIRLYQAILQQSGYNRLTDSESQSQIKQRIDTLRYEQDYLSQFARNKVRVINHPAAGMAASL